MLYSPLLHIFIYHFMLIILRIQLVCQLLEIIGFLSKSQRGNMKNWLHTWVEVGFNKPEYMRYPQFGGDGCLQLRWKLFFCMRTCNIFSLGEWFLTFFVHTDFYSFTAGKNAEFDLRISCKPWAVFSWNLDKECIPSWRTIVARSSLIECTLFEKWPSSPTTNSHFSWNPWCGFV